MWHFSPSRRLDPCPAAVPRARAHSEPASFYPHVAKGAVRSAPSTNFYLEENQDLGRATPLKDRPVKHVCPQFQAPVGTGIALYGANENIIERNHIYDNWRAGVRLFGVPAAVRGERDPAKANDTSHGNKIRNTVFGIGIGEEARSPSARTCSRTSRARATAGRTAARSATG